MFSLNKSSAMYILIFQSLLCFKFFMSANAAWGMGSEKKVLLTDVNVLTLYDGKMTKGRRSSPVSQLECVSGGSAPCSTFKPRVVQCTNKGSDGYDVQWECKTDMDNSYRFGQIEVSCEGFDYPDDPYILQGSCGLRYSIDYTKEGMNEKSQHNYYGNDDHQGSSQYQHKKASSSSMFADLIVYIVGGVMLYAFYKTCIGGSGRQTDDRNDYSNTNDDYPSGGTGGGYGWFGQGTQGSNAPNSRYNSYRDDASCGARQRGNNATGGAGGFWTGAATGGLLGYMFGNSGRQNYGNSYGRYPRGGGGGWSSSFSSPSSGGFGSSGTRSASGFGGTSRR